MELYLIRHGIAAERTDYSHDEERPLTEQGRQKTTKVAQRLVEVGSKFDLILTSPLVRAKETAEILKKIGLSQEIALFLPLSPNGNLQDWIEWYCQSHHNNDTSCLALVGHQPDLGDWAEILVWGKAKGKLELKKAGIIGLSLPKTITPIGNSQLFLLTSPKWLLEKSDR